MVTVSHTVCAHEVSRIFGDPGTQPIWNRSVTDHLQMPLPKCCLAKCGRSRSNGRCIIFTEIRRKKIGTLVSRRSRSLKVNGTDTDRSATYDFLLVVLSNRGSISCRFRDKRRFQSKITNFSNPQCI